MDRDKNGQFAKGNPGGPGRQKRKTEEKYLRALQKCVKAKDWKAICERAIIDAKKGDRSARQWLSDYLLGKPIQELKVDARTDLNIILTWDDDNAEPDAPEAP